MIRIHVNTNDKEHKENNRDNRSRSV